MPSADYAELLETGSRELGFPLSEAQGSAFLLYLEELLRWNQKINLTGIRSPREIIIKHFLDSLSGLLAFEPKPGLRVMDIGSGAGFPGLPIKIYAPFLSMTLLDPSHKKTAFLYSLCGRLGSHVEIITNRIEQVARQEPLRGSFDILLTRAFMKSASTLRDILLLLAPGGRLILFKGPREDPQETETLLQGQWSLKTIPLFLPISHHQRRLVIIERG